MGVYENEELTFIGQAGTGFTDKKQTEILQKLKPLQTKKCPFKEKPIINKPTQFRRNPPKATITWVKPLLVCEVRYQELTSDGIMRHPSFQGMREADTVLPVTEDRKSNAPDPLTLKNPKTVKPLKEINGPPFLNPKEEIQSKKVNGHELKFTNLGKLYWTKKKSPSAIC